MKTFIALLTLSVAAATKAQVITNIKVPRDSVIDTKDSLKAREALEKLGVKYLWKMDESDTTVENEELVVQDFMGNSTAHSEGSLVSLKTCKRGNKLNKFVLFERYTPDSPVGGHLLVKERIPYSKINKDTEFTVGGWFKQYPQFVTDFRFITPDKLAPGFYPALTRYTPVTDERQGNLEWMFQLTTERAYVNIHRGYTGQNDMNAKVPWWAHTFGTCYQGGYHKECWHYVSVSVKPSENKVQFVMIRQPGWFFADGGPETDYVATYVTDRHMNNHHIPQTPGSIFRIGAHDTSGTHGIIRGLFFATKALTPEESKAISDYTAPTKTGFLCGGNELE